eukprot:116273-Rhodomonas_salina.2
MRDVTVGTCVPWGVGGQRHVGQANRPDYRWLIIGPARSGTEVRYLPTHALYCASVSLYQLLNCRSVW